ncbi:MAG: biotin transporter BioY [Clostridia bacterium]|nr:biotin transporter BioY [Clostridia bacterium]
MKSSKIFDLTLTALFSVIICICSWLSIPSAVPFTLQTFAVFLTLLVLGGKRGTTAIALYILLGAVGLPVFHSFTGGPGILLGPGGGYITGFLLLSLTYWLITKKAGENIRTKVFALLTGILLCYLTGCIQFALVSKVSVKSAVLTCVVPFILPDAVKLILSLLLSNKLAKINKV